MQAFDSIDTFRAAGAAALGEGVVAILLAEDATEIDSTLAHLDGLGFGRIVMFAPDHVSPAAPPASALRVRWAPGGMAAACAAVNAVIAMGPGRWMHYAYNAEYLFYPFCETRRVGELLAFHAEERRDAMLTYVIDLYAGDPDRAPDGVDRADAYLDRAGYYALARTDPARHDHPMERQLDFFGGLRRRFEEHVPDSARRIDRVGLFRARAGLGLRPDHTFDIAEYNTYACPWHSNLTAAICSFRAAKALRTNPASRRDVHRLTWHSSVPFTWQSSQLMDLGLMEPGQWF